MIFILVYLSFEFFDIGSFLFVGDEGKGYDIVDVYFGVEDFGLEVEFLCCGFYVFEIFLVVGVGMMDLDLDVVFVESFGVFFEGFDYIFEGGGNVGEVGNIIIDE